ncbi:MAG: hypothetical protein KGL74_14690 [Elusimicrobia bacterium]|nr:hypothetical protein [Elusimicrobiota bacterium]
MKRWWFALVSLSARLRFRAGRASFVECVIARTDSLLTTVQDPAGRPLGPKLLARRTLSCRPPRAGAAGWTLYEERLFRPGPHRFASLECAHCGHLYVIQIQVPGVALDAPDADFRSEWFRFAPSAFDGPTSLSCPRCEEVAAPAVVHLSEP